MDLKNISTKWKWVAGIVIVLLVIFFGVRIKHNGSSVTVPKHVSFVQQAKGSGTHVWYMATGQAKDSNVYYIIVLKNGKARTYRMYDDDTTLGKVSKMSNSQAIRYAKDQDKKYFDVSAKEASMAMDDEHNGFNADFQSAITMPEFSMLTKDGKATGLAIKTNNEDTTEGTKYVTFNADGKMTSSAKGTAQLPDGVAMSDPMDIPASTDNNDSNKAIIKKVYGGVIDHIKKTSYQAPEAMKVKATSKTDDSGNDIISQEATIQYTSGVDGDAVKDNFLDMAENDPSMVKRLYQLAKTYYDAEHVTNEKVDATFAAYKDGVDKMFTKRFCYDLTKDVFSNEQEEYTMTLKEPLGFDIYNAHFIGYYRGAHNGYLVTKAQNDKQDAIFAK